MVAKIKYRPVLPIKPTSSPNGEDISRVATAALDIAQHSLLSPAAVISALACALSLYEAAAAVRGFDSEVIIQCRGLGEKLANTLLAHKKAQGPKLVDALGLPITNSTDGLLDSSGNLLEVEPEVDPNAVGHAPEESTDGEDQSPA